MMAVIFMPRSVRMRSSTASLIAAADFVLVNTTLPVWMWVTASSKPAATNAARRSAIFIRLAAPTLTARNTATNVGTPRTYRRPTRRIDAMDILYTATAHATGDGRNGHATSDDGILDLDLRIPKAMGGPGGATNPEQLFAAGYAACFHSALKFVASRDQLDVTGTEVSAQRRHRRCCRHGGFGLAVELDVHAPNLDHDTALALVAAGARGVPVLERHPRQHRGQALRGLKVRV